MEPFEPIPKLWRFHALYLFVTVAMGWSVYPASNWQSIFLTAVLCVMGLIFAYFELPMPVHILATVVGLTTPVVVLIRPAWTTTAVFLAVFTLIITLFRKYLF